MIRINEVKVGDSLTVMSSYGFGGCNYEFRTVSKVFKKYIVDSTGREWNEYGRIRGDSYRGPRAWIEKPEDRAQQKEFESQRMIRNLQYKLNEFDFRTLSDDLILKINDLIDSKQEAK